jgi:hypothetical protein
VTDNAPSNRRIDTCPRCAAIMTQYDRATAAVWSVAELAADLARCSEDDDAWLVWYSACPDGCKQCFRCLGWLRPNEICPRCPSCPECGGPLMAFIDEDDDGNEIRSIGCLRCIDAAFDDEEDDDDEGDDEAEAELGN